MEIPLSSILVLVTIVVIGYCQGKLIGYVGIGMFPLGTEVDARIPRGE